MLPRFSNRFTSLVSASLRADVKRIGEDPRLRLIGDGQPELHAVDSWAVDFGCQRIAPCCFQDDLAIAQ